MPAMKPSTTSRARTSSVASRATTAGSRNARPSADPRATPRGGWEPEAERGNEALTRAPLRRASPAPRSRRLLPRPGDHLLVVALERFALEAALDLPALESCQPEQQLQLVEVDPALPRMGAVRGDHLARGIDLAHLD